MLLLSVKAATPDSPQDAIFPPIYHLCLLRDREPRPQTNSVPLSAYSSVPVWPACVLMGSKTLEHKAFFLSPSLHSMKFLGRGRAWLLDRSSPNPTQFLNGEPPSWRLPSSQASGRKKGLLKVPLGSHTGTCQLQTVRLCVRRICFS